MAFAATAFACSSESAAEGAEGCEAGQSQACECDSGQRGTEVCNAEGTDFGACSCAAASGAGDSSSLPSDTITPTVPREDAGGADSSLSLPDGAAAAPTDAGADGARRDAGLAAFGSTCARDKDCVTGLCARFQNIGTRCTAACSLDAQCAIFGNSTCNVQNRVCRIPTAP